VRSCGTQLSVTQERRFTDDLPSISISRLRAEGVITPETKTFLVKLGDVEAVVGVKERRFPNGGSWSLFVAPCCGKSVRVLRLLSGRVLCCRCCRAHGVFYRGELMKPRRRAAKRVPKLLEWLNSTGSFRRKPHLWGTMERRTRHEAALQRNLLTLRRHELAALAKALGKTKPKG
jgi:hypothetical protein